MATFRTLEISNPRFEHEGLRCVTVKSAALRGRADITLFVPKPGEGEAALPLVILLHGAFGSHWAWALKGGAHRVAEGLRQRDEIPPMVLAMPSDGLWGDGSGYLRHREHDFERWIVDEVPAAVRQVVGRVSADSPLFIAGLSMGGFGALCLGAKYADRFRGISAHSAVTHVNQMRDVLEEDPARFAASDADGSALEAIVASRGRLPPIRFDCGLSDSLIEQSRELHRQLTARGIAHRYEENPGGHEWSYWERHVADTLRFFGEIARGLVR